MPLALSQRYGGLSFPLCTGASQMNANVKYFNYCSGRGIGVLAIGATLCINSWAEDPNPYYAGVSLGYNHDSNIFRVPNAIGDNYISTGLLGGFDQPIGRQRIYANGTLRKNRFNKLSELDNTSYSLTAGLDWSTIEKISGGLVLSTNQGLASYSTGTNALPVQVRNVEKSKELVARVQYGLASRLSLTGSATHRELEYSALAYQPNNYEMNIGSAGVKYRPSAALTAGVALRVSRGHYTKQFNINGEPASLERDDVDWTVTWAPTGESTIDARLSTGRRSGDAISQQDFSGVTGAVSWLFQPTGKLNFKTSLVRDTGIETNFLNVAQGQSVGTGDNNRLTTAIGLTANYSATAKILATANANYSHRSLTFTPQAGQASIEGTDSTKSFSIGANYKPTRNSLVNCAVGRQSRSTSSVLSFEYSANTASCSAQLTVQ